MKKMLLACASALALAAPAQAINMTVTADLTLYETDWDPVLPPWEWPEVVTPLGYHQYIISEDAATGMSRIDGLFIGNEPCYEIDN